MFISSIFGIVDDLMMIILGLASVENYLVSQKKGFKRTEPHAILSPLEGNSAEKKNKTKKADA